MLLSKKNSFIGGSIQHLLILKLPQILLQIALLMTLLEIFPLGLFLIAFVLYQLLKNKVPSYKKPIRLKIYFVYFVTYL